MWNPIEIRDEKIKLNVTPYKYGAGELQKTKHFNRFEQIKQSNLFCVACVFQKNFTLFGA
jgi:hypothetical protein